MGEKNGGEGMVDGVGGVGRTSEWDSTVGSRSSYRAERTGNSVAVQDTLQGNMKTRMNTLLRARLWGTKRVE